MPSTAPFSSRLEAEDGRSPRVLVIDDEPRLRHTLADYLEDLGCQTALAANGADALAVLDTFLPDVVLADLNMPVMDGYTFIREALARQPHLPVVVVSGVGTVDKAVEALRLGAWEFITKPVSRFEVVECTLVRVLERARLLRENRRYQHRLELLVNERTAELMDTRRQILFSLGKAAEYRDNETGRHVIRVGEMCAAVGNALGLPAARVEMLREAAPLHDIGKIGVPDEILLKPSPLNPQEWELMKRHCEYGCLILSQPQADEHPERNAWPLRPTPSDAPAPPGLMPLARTIALAHHERWDGGGYPRGLAGEDIPLEARIVSVVDVYDALCSDRPYKQAMSPDKAGELLRAGAGTQFDPAVVDAFFRNEAEIIAIRERWSD